MYSHEHGRFSELRGSNVLIYWPHGFGDWVQLAYIAPLLEPSNRYWITHHGDDTTTLMEGHALLTPVYTGVRSTRRRDGGVFGNRGLGIEYKDARGEEVELHLPVRLSDACRKENITAALWSSFPEPAGRMAFPFHSKARNLLRYLVSEDRLREVDLGRALASSVNWEAPGFVAAWVESRLRNVAGLDGSRLCIIGRNGYTSVGKNWGHEWREEMPEGKRREGEECREFMRLLRQKDPRWAFLVMEDRLYEGDDTVRDPSMRAVSYAELFGTPGESLPFGLVMKAVLRHAELMVGVPAGPYHLSMASGQHPTVGIWTEHLPSWFDEPNSSSVHLISRNVRDRELHTRPGSFSSHDRLGFQLVWLETRVVTGEQVLGAVESLFR
jgi:hypothetical protein